MAIKGSLKEASLADVCQLLALGLKTGPTLNGLAAQVEAIETATRTDAATAEAGGTAGAPASAASAGQASAASAPASTRWSGASGRPS